ncbi:MAG: glycosyltransferase family 4 protein [Phycisphaerae bacterium]
MPALWREVDPTRFDVLVYPWNARYLHLLPALKRARRRGVATLAWGHGYSKRETPWRRTLRLRVARAVDVVLTYGRSAAEGLIVNGFDAERVCVAPNALDQRPIQEARQRWVENPGELESFRRRRGLEGRVVALYVSRLVYRHDTEILLQAWRQIRRRVPEALLVIVGEGRAHGAMERCCHKYDLTDSVAFWGAVYDEDELAPLFLSARLFACPRRLGLSLHHAFGYGLPVVTFDNPQTHGPEFEALESGVNGIAVTEDDLDALTESVHRLLCDPELAGELGTAARETVLREYTLERMVDGLLRGIARARSLAEARGA